MLKIEVIIRIKGFPLADNFVLADKLLFSADEMSFLQTVIVSEGGRQKGRRLV